MNPISPILQVILSANVQNSKITTPISSSQISNQIIPPPAQGSTPTHIECRECSKQETHFCAEDKILTGGNKSRNLQSTEEETSVKNLISATEIFYNWDEILRERNLQSKHREIERQTRINKASNLKGTWDLMKVCKGFLEEWDIDWVEGSEKAKERQDKKQEEIDKNYRFRRIEIKRQDQIRNKLWS